MVVIVTEKTNNNNQSGIIAPAWLACNTLEASIEALVKWEVGEALAADFILSNSEAKGYIDGRRKHIRLAAQGIARRQK
jgi:hypothetical protein